MQADSTRPVVNITWNEARTVCQQAGGDLPTEAQWEYAARGGSRFPWSFGDDEGLLKYYAWYADNAKEVQEAGQQLPNPLGLYDMHGNAWEWVRDWYGEYVPGIEVDPVGPSSGCLPGGARRVVRLPPEVLRSADRDVVHPEDRAQVRRVPVCARPPSLEPLML